MSKYFDEKLSSFMAPTVTQNGGHMVMTNVYKPNKIKYVNIDTRFQDEYNLNKKASFVYHLPQKIVDVKSIKVKSAEVPISFYNFSLSRGNTFFTVDLSNVVIPDGQYTASSLASTINSKLISLDLSNVYVNVESNNQISVHVTSRGPYNIYFDRNTTGGFDKYNLKSKLGWCLGFRQPEYQISTSSPIYSEGLVDLNNIRYLFLVVDEYRQSNPNSFVSPLATANISKNVLARISLNPAFFPFGQSMPVNTATGFLLSDERTYAGKTDIQKLLIQLVDEWGNLVDLNELDFSFCLEIEHE
jgi:hypothetical protein